MRVIRQRRGFTIVELLVVVAIIGVLAAMLLPAINGAIGMARRMQCTNKQRQIATATIAYDSTKERMPYLRRDQDQYGNALARPEPWIYPLLSGMGLSAIVDDYENTLTRAADKGAGGFPIVEFQCPTDPALVLEINKLSYVPNGGIPHENNLQLDYVHTGSWSAIWGLNLPDDLPIKQTLANIQKADGQQMTLMLSESIAAPTGGAHDWYNVNREEYLQQMLWVSSPTASGGGSVNPPTQDIELVQFIPTSPEMDNLAGGTPPAPSSRHGNGFVAAFCDGRAAWINSKIGYSVYARMMTSNGQRVASDMGVNWQSRALNLTDLDP